MTVISTSPRGASFFSRKRAIRTASGIATAGMMVGISLAGATSASAATDADCTVGNTVDSTAAGTAGDIQILLDASTPVVCLSGTFVLAVPFGFDYDLTIHGLTDAVLDGDGATQILIDDGENTLIVENLRVTGGDDSDFGGAINGFTVEVHNSQFDNNAAEFGGAIAATNVTVFDSLFVDNQASFGGAVVVEDEFTTTRSIFSSNTAGSLGGAVMSYGIATSVESTFEGNYAAYVGGAIVAYGTVTSDASTFEGNSADEFGGAIATQGTVDIQNSTFVGNLTTDGASSAIDTGNGSIRQSTFVDNTANDDVPAGPSVFSNDGELEVRGNIFVGSSGPAHLGADSQNGLIVDLGANVFTTTQAAETALSSVQPTTQFGVTAAAIFAGAVLADNTGPTQTVALHAGSPALSAVPADAASMTVDQRGVARPAISDAGAYEFDDTDPAGGSGDGAELANTGTETAGWLTGMAALLFAGGLTVLGFTRRRAGRAL